MLIYHLKFPYYEKKNDHSILLISMVGQTDSVGGLSPLMPYPGYATNLRIKKSSLARGKAFIYDSS